MSRHAGLSALLAAAALALALPAALRAEVFLLKDGDRITGTIVSETKNSLVVKSAYGNVTLPRTRILRIIKDDGTDRTFTVPTTDLGAKPTPTPAAAAKTILVLTVSGVTFWHAWEDKDAPADPSLRLAVSVDEKPVAAYLDPVVESGEIKNAVLNSFGFAKTMSVGADTGAVVAPPDVQPGRITLRIELPPAVAPGTHAVRLSYQVNTGAKGAAQWQDVLTASTQAALRGDAPTIVRAQQEAGEMTFDGRGKRTMKKVETFRIGLAPGE